uniref:Immunoglobulin V-set domain-containing protein n=1 Tax=Oreochromis aureus TaxID=47969 RepID=A0A668TQF0_OREAU
RHLNYCPIPLTDGSIINVEGFEGKNVSFQCKHKIASKSNKYFCKDPCKGEGDILVTVEPGRRAESGRIALVDSGDGSFTVTFSHLQLSDSQKYWCAVDRLGFDTFTEVQLAGSWVGDPVFSVLFMFSLVCHTNVPTSCFFPCQLVSLVRLCSALYSPVSNHCHHSTCVFKLLGFTSSWSCH